MFQLSSITQTVTAAALTVSFFVGTYMIGTHEAEKKKEQEKLEQIGEITTNCGGCLLLPQIGRMITEFGKCIPIPKHLDDDYIRRQFRKRRILHTKQEMEYFHSNMDRSTIKRARHRRQDTDEDQTFAENLQDQRGLLKKANWVVRSHQMAEAMERAAKAERRKKILFIRRVRRSKRSKNTNRKKISFTMVSLEDHTKLFQPRVTAEQQQRENDRQQTINRLFSSIVPLPSAIATFNEDGARRMTGGRGLILD